VAECRLAQQARLPGVKHCLALAAGLLVTMVAGAAPALAADPIMALKDVRAGMRCTGLSVIKGTAIARFDVEVIDVIRADAAASGGPRLLIRASGPAVEETGLGPGFSGSPILCPDASGVFRNVGAVSEGIGDYGNDIALATPIELMLGERPATPRRARSAPRLLRRARRIATPLTVTGLSGPLRTRVARAARRAGRPVLAVPPGPLAGFPTQDLRPGAAVSTSLSSGDVTIGAVGTVTYRDGPSVWAFGHPLDQVGRRSLLLQDAYVYTVVGNPLGLGEASSYKLAVPGHTVGILSNDTVNAVIGRIGQPPRTIAMSVTARAVRRVRTLRTQVADERDLELGSGLDLVGSMSLSQALADTLGSSPPAVSSSMCVRIAVRERGRALGFCDEYVDPNGPLDDLSSALGLIDAFEYGPLTPRSVSVRLRARPGAHKAFLLGARGPRRARPGQRIRIRLDLRRSRGGRFGRSFSYRVPPGTRPGPRVLTLRGASVESPEESLEESISEAFGGGGGGGEGESPHSLRALAVKIAALGRPDGVRASFGGKGRGPVVLATPRLLIGGKAQLPLRIVRPRRAGRTS